MRNQSAFLAVLLLGACVAAYAQAQKPVQATVQATSSTHQGKHDKVTVIEGTPGPAGPQGPAGPTGATGAQGHPGKNGKNGEDGLNGRDAWVTLAWRSGPAAKVNITSGEHAKHVVNQLISTASCGEGEKAVACSCDTAQSSSAGVGFVVPKKASYQGSDGGAFLGRANYITLAENALTGPANKAYKDACTCTGLYVATVRGKSTYQYKEVAEEEEEDEYTKKPKYVHHEKPKHADDDKYYEKDDEKYYEKDEEKKYEKKEKYVDDEEKYAKKPKYDDEEKYAKRKYDEEKYEKKTQYELDEEKYEKKKKYTEKPKYEEEEEEEKYEEEPKKYKKKHVEEKPVVEKPKQKFFDAFKWHSAAEIQQDGGVAVANVPDATATIEAATPDDQASIQGAHKAATAGYYVEDWTKKMPKWQAFEITATVTCQAVKLVPRPDHKDEYDPEDSYGYKKDKKEYKKDKKSYDDDKDEDWFGKKDGDKKYYKEDDSAEDDNEDI